VDVVNEIIIVGGGTAGWLTAANLGKKFKNETGQSVKITLIESPDIPTIGVGEGTWPTMRKTLANLGIDESEFMTFTNASFKQATKFVNWKATPENDQKNHYYHLFTSITDAAEFNLGPYWALGDKSTTYADAISAQAQICEMGLAPKTIATAAYEGMQNYAYHLDAGKFAKLLKKVAVEKFDVEYISANVTGVNLSVDGYISSVDTDTAGRKKAGFFVDCSGFKSLLLGETLGIKFKSIKDTLLTDHAIAIQVPYKDMEQPISSSTISTAHEAGWTWDIGLANRRGTGYVYSSEFVDHDTAEQTLRDYIGPESKGLESRLIKMNCGYREKFWHKNCVAIGLSAAFVEPLEASAIFLVEASANMLCDQFPRNREVMHIVEKKFNKSFEFRWQKTIDFIKMHYFLSKRKEPFWQANKNLNTVPDSLLEILEHWKYHPVSKYDFTNVFEPFPQESYQYILYGMEFNQQLKFNESAFNMNSQAQMHFKKVQEITDYLSRNLPSNRALLKKVNQFGFQSI